MTWRSDGTASACGRGHVALLYDLASCDGVHECLSGMRTMRTTRSGIMDQRTFIASGMRTEITLYVVVVDPCWHGIFLIVYNHGTLIDQPVGHILVPVLSSKWWMRGREYVGTSRSRGGGGGRC